MKAFIFTVILCLLIFSSLIGWIKFNTIQIQQPQFFVVQPGQGFNQFCRQLVNQGVTPFCGPLKWYSKVFSSLREIKQGVYQLQPGISLETLLKIIRSGRVHQFSFSLIEGQTYQQIYMQMEKTPYLIFDLPNMVGFNWSNLGIPEQHLEGKLFPDTYYYEAYSKASQLILRAYTRMQKELSVLWDQRISDLPYNTPEEVLIMASIIEKETGKADERPIIASVFVNRLFKGMRLQTDPTVIYGLGEQFDGNLTRQHLKQKKPYNTYRISGLPPTPIALPSKAAIIAAINPATTDYYYFVAKGDGSHQFSHSLTEHNQAVRQYQIK